MIVHRIADARPGSISKTLLWNLGTIGAIMAIALLSVLYAAANHSFTELEDQDIAAHTARIKDFKQNNLKTIEARSKDWGVWDDTYDYARSFNSRYVESNLNGESFKNAMFDGLAVLQSSTGAIRAFAFDHTTGQPIPELSSALKRMIRTADIAGRLRGRSSTQAFVSLNGRIYTLSAAKIMQSDGYGNSPGYLVLVQHIGAEQASRALQAQVTLTTEKNANAPTEIRKPDKIIITSPLLDLAGKPAGSLSISTKRPLLAEAGHMIAMASVGAMVVALVMFAALHWRLRQLVLSPIERLHSHLQTIRATGEFSVLDATPRNDELGAVQEEFNRMAEELQKLRAQVESQSYKLGMSQSAVGLMHNLRNCLSPVRVILDKLDRDIAAPMPPQVTRALKELASNETNPPRREKLAEFVTVSHDQIKARDANNRHAVREAARNLMSAFAAIDSAQQAKGEVSFVERCEIASMVSHAANIVRYSDGSAVNVEVSTVSGAIASGNRVLLSQVIENLVTNALESVRASGREDGEIVLDVTGLADEAMCRITVTDNGGGFDAAAAGHLFDRGYSTRETKSGGLGLHWCANTVKAMGGTLRLDSAGLGLGARATIELAQWRQEHSLIA